MRISDWSSDVCSSDLLISRRAVVFCFVWDGGLLQSTRSMLLLTYIYVWERETPPCLLPENAAGYRSEEHTSELQSLMRISYAVFCLKKKKQKKNTRSCMKQKKHTKTQANNYRT